MPAKDPAPPQSSRKRLFALPLSETAAEAAARWNRHRCRFGDRYPHPPASNSHPRLLTQADFMPHRPGCIQQMKPDGINPFSQFAFCPHNPAGIILAYAALLQEERCVSQSPDFSVAVQKPVVFLRFLAFPNTLFTVRMVGIIMVLVHGAHRSGRVHDRDTRMQRIPE